MKYFFSILIVAFLVIVLYSVRLYLLEDSCLDSGKGVWDIMEKRCRNDCLKYDKNFGCILLLPDEIELMKNCQHQQCLSNEKLKEICLRNHKAFDIENILCDFEFQIDDCNKKQGNWIYPDICTEK